MNEKVSILWPFPYVNDEKKNMKMVHLLASPRANIKIVSLKKNPFIGKKTTLLTKIPLRRNEVSKWYEMSLINR